MSQTQMTVGKQAFKLYNKVGATEREKQRAVDLIKGEAVDSLDAYGKFVRAEIIFWQDYASSQDRIDAFDTFRAMSIDANLPQNLIVGARFYAGRCYELGFATEHNFDSALICYRMANKLNPKACLKDIARLEKSQTQQPVKNANGTPAKYRYDGWTFADYMAEERIKKEDDIHTNFIDGLKTLKRTGFFYEDDPDEVDIDLYNVPINNDEDD
ncbi:MAG: hypothetical protein K2M64_01470 [Clostridia bacterium]|nr:hypothetical protein [Clostridia bacterium]